MGENAAQRAGSGLPLSASHLKPEMSVAIFTPVSQELLTEFETGHGLSRTEFTEAATAAGRMARREADAALYERLARSGFAGQEYEMFRGELAAYAFPALRLWVRTGQIFACCAQRGRPVHCTDRERRHLSGDEGDRSDLASETAAIALNIFRDHVLIPGKWSSTAGASLRTYFVGACLNAFPNVFRRWATEQRKWAETGRYGVAFDLDLAGHHGRSSVNADPAEIVIAEHVVYDVLSTTPAPAREAAARRVFLDQKFIDIAKHLGITERAVEGLLYRVRRENFRRRRQESVQR